MTNINSLAKFKLAKAWAMNNSMSNKPTSTVEATEQVVHILNAKYENSDFVGMQVPGMLSLRQGQTQSMFTTHI